MCPGAVPRLVTICQSHAAHTTPYAQINPHVHTAITPPLNSPLISPQDMEDAVFWAKASGIASFVGMIIVIVIKVAFGGGSNE